MSSLHDEPAADFPDDGEKAQAHSQLEAPCGIVRGPPGQRRHRARLSSARGIGSYDPARIVAQIETRPEGRPVRLRGHGRRNRSVGRYASVKSGRSLPWESRNELHDLMRAEVDHRVESSRVQPHTLRFIMDDQLRRYTPDREDLLVDGSIEIIEVKEDFDEQDDPDYSRKLRYAEAFYIGLGWKFLIRSRKEIEAQPSFAAVDEIQFYRRTIFTELEVAVVLQALTTGKAKTLGDILELLPDSPVGFAKVAAMVVRRVIRVELEAPLSFNTSVYATKGQKHA